MKFSLPKYYDKLIKRETPDQLEDFKSKRTEKSFEFIEHTTPDRLAVREHVEKSHRKRQNRSFNK